VSASGGKIGNGASISLMVIRLYFACNAVTVLIKSSAETFLVFCDKSVNRIYYIPQHAVLQ